MMAGGSRGGQVLKEGPISSWIYGERTRKGRRKEESRGLDRSCFQRQSPPTVEQVGYGLRLKAVYAPITGHPLVTRHTKAYS